MKSLEQLLIRIRSGLRARLPRVRGDRPPARLALRLDDHDAPGPVPSGTMDADGWYEAIVAILEWAGPLPVTVIAHADNPLLPEVVRFCHRLECPVTLRTDTNGLTVFRAEELVDAGVDVALVRLAHPAVTQFAVSALLSARRSRRAKLGIELEIPADSRLKATIAESRGMGVDGVRITAPFDGGPFDGETLTWAEAQPRPFHRTEGDVFSALRRMSGDGPGCARERGSCPVGGIRVEILPDRTLRSCPFKEGPVRLGEAAAAAWSGLERHRAEIRSCGRRCAHPDLLP